MQDFDLDPGLLTFFAELTAGAFALIFAGLLLFKVVSKIKHLRHRRKARRKHMQSPVNYL